MYVRPSIYPEYSMWEIVAYFLWLCYYFVTFFFSSKKRLEVHNRAITKLGKQENEVCLQSTLWFDVEAKPKWHLLSTTIITKTLQEVVDIYAWLPLTLQKGLKYLRGKTSRKPEYERLDLSQENVQIVHEWVRRRYAKERNVFSILCMTA